MKQIEEMNKLLLIKNTNLIFHFKGKISKIYRCTEYMTLNKWKSLIILNDKKEVFVKSSIRNRLQITNFNTKIKKTRNKNSFF